MEKEYQNLVNGFAQLYLQKKGYSPDESVDEKGDLKPNLVKELEWAMQQTDESFWDNFVKDPDTTMDKFLEDKSDYDGGTEQSAETTPAESETSTDDEDQAVLAKKGAKLKKLQDFKNKAPKKTKKCSCGCDMISKKEKGGKMVEVCACGCHASKTKKHRIGGKVNNDEKKHTSSKVLAELKKSKTDKPEKKEKAKTNWLQNGGIAKPTTPTKSKYDPNKPYSKTNFSGPAYNSSLNNLTGAQIQKVRDYDRKYTDDSSTETAQQIIKKLEAAEAKKAALKKLKK